MRQYCKNKNAGREGKYFIWILQRAIHLTVTQSVKVRQRKSQIATATAATGNGSHFETVT